MSSFKAVGNLRQNEMEVVKYLIENPWLFFVLLIPLVAPFETLLLLISLAYAFIVYLPYKVILSTYCLLYTSPSPRDQRGSRMPSSA